MHNKNDNNLKVVTIWYLAFSSKEDFCCKNKKLVTGNEATVHLAET